MTLPLVFAFAATQSRKLGWLIDRNFYAISINVCEFAWKCEQGKLKVESENCKLFPSVLLLAYFRTFLTLIRTLRRV